MAEKKTLRLPFLQSLPNEIDKLTSATEDLARESFRKRFRPSTRIASRSSPRCGRNELLVICAVRNGHIYVNSFIQHYFAMGVKHLSRQRLNR